VIERILKCSKLEIQVNSRSTKDVETACVISMAYIFFIYHCYIMRILGEESYPQAIYLGCYGEKMGDDKNRLLKFPHERYEDNTPQKCSEECFKIGFLYSGTTNGEKLG
jgi:hypothetical protein